LSLLAGYLNFHSWWRRAVILLLCFPLVYAGNVARIISIVFAAQIGGPKWGDVAHEVMGYGVFLIVLGGALAAVSALRRWWPERPQQIINPEALPQTSPARKSRVGAWSVAGLVVMMAGAEFAFLHHLQQLPPRGLTGVAVAADGLNPVELPAFLGTDWIGRRAEVSAVEREILPQDTGFSRKNYISLADSRQNVFLSIVLSGRDRTSIHRPELCLVGQGWTIAESLPYAFRYPGTNAGQFQATLLRVRREVSTARGKETVPQLVAYWFVGGDAVVGTHGSRLLRDAWNRVVHARADRWAYVLMQTDARDGEAAALARMQTVLDATLPSFQSPRTGGAKEARTSSDRTETVGVLKKT
jgi:EpsI family protein